MRKTKKLTALMLLIALVMGVVSACGGGSTETEGAKADSETKNNTAAASSSEETTGEAEELKIAVVMYNWADDQGLYLQQCGAYLEENFPVKFEYITTGQDADEIINTIDELCTAGYDGIMNAMTAGFQSWAQICEDNGVYFSILLTTIDEDDEEFASGLEYFCGSAHRSDWTQLGRDYANQALEAGCFNILYAGFAEGMLKSNDQMIKGFKEVMDTRADVTYNVITQYPDNLFEAITTELAGGGYDCVVTSVSVMDFGVGNIYANDLVGTTSAIGHNVDETLDEAMEAGIVIYATDNLTSIMNMNYVMIANAVNGKELEGTPDGYWNIETPSVAIDSVETLSTYREYVRSTDEDNPTYAFNADEVRKFLTSENPDATFSEFESFIVETTLEKIVERHQ